MGGSTARPIEAGSTTTPTEGAGIKGAGDDGDDGPPASVNGHGDYDEEQVEPLFTVPVDPEEGV